MYPKLYHWSCRLANPAISQTQRCHCTGFKDKKKNGSYLCKIALTSVTQTHQWAHCAGKENPADIPSRGIDTLELGRKQFALAIYGLGWLQTEVPGYTELTEMPELCDLEQKKTRVAAALLAMDSQCSIGSLIKCENFSSKEIVSSDSIIIIMLCGSLNL